MELHQLAIMEGKILQEEEDPEVEAGMIKIEEMMKKTQDTINEEGKDLPDVVGSFDSGGMGHSDLMDSMERGEFGEGIPELDRHTGAGMGSIEDMVDGIHEGAQPDMRSDKTQGKKVNESDSSGEAFSGLRTKHSSSRSSPLPTE